MQEKRIDALMRGYDAPSLPGACVVVVRDGIVLFRKSYGMADLENRITATPATNYRLASVTKQFTAAAILILNEQGKLALDDPITRFLPEMPPFAGGITIRHLLTHTSGLLAYEDLIPARTTKQLHDEDVPSLLARTSTTDFPPGTHHRYSNTGYALLALIVQRASGRRFAGFLHDAIFAPAGMRSTVTFVEGISTVAIRAYGYSREGDAGCPGSRNRRSVCPPMKTKPLPSRAAPLVVLDSGDEVVAALRSGWERPTSPWRSDRGATANRSTVNGSRRSRGAARGCRGKPGRW